MRAACTEACAAARCLPGLAVRWVAHLPASETPDKRCVGSGKNYVSTMRFPIQLRSFVRIVDIYSGITVARGPAEARG